MMSYNIISGEITPGILYEITGDQSVVYNSNTYDTGQRFRGVAGVTTFTYSGAGSQEITEVVELLGGVIEYNENAADQPVNYPDITRLSGFAIEFNLNEAEKTVQETTKITGFAIELVDYPFYSFEITETRL